jgi:hypothetical protein
VSIVGWAATGWLGWFALVALVSFPVYGGAVLAVVLSLLLVRYHYRRVQRRAALAAYRERKAEYHRNQRVLRAQTYPDRVFDDHVDEWEKEFRQ